jgi:hypothetical protein
MKLHDIEFWYVDITEIYLLFLTDWSYEDIWVNNKRSVQSWINTG